MAQVLALRATKEEAPTTVNRKVALATPLRKPNKEYRTREYLTPEEVDKVIKAAAKEGRHGHRDSTLLLILYRHGFRVSELVSLQWDAIDFTQGFIHVSRMKNGIDSIHPLSGRELRALRKLRKDYPDTPYLFQSELKAPLKSDAVRKIITRAGNKADLGFTIHPHMFRHACGYKLANDGHDTRAIQQYLGHKNIQHTVRYTDLAPNRFKGFFKD